jgi:hypothetical protein
VQLVLGTDYKMLNLRTTTSENYILSAFCSFFGDHRLFSDFKKYKMKKSLLLVLVISALAISPAAYSRNPGTGTNDTTYIYVYRTGQFNGAGANWAVYLDGEKKCKLSNNRFMRLAVPPGKQTISAKVGGASLFKKETEVEIEAEAGGSYFIACNVKQSITRARLEMIEVTKGSANKQMEKMVLDNCQEKIDD